LPPLKWAEGSVQVAESGATKCLGEISLRDLIFFIVVFKIFFAVFFFESRVFERGSA